MTYVETAECILLRTLNEFGKNKGSSNSLAKNVFWLIAIFKYVSVMVTFRVYDALFINTESQIMGS